jgi:hypothetical protein
VQVLDVCGAQPRDAQSVEDQQRHHRLGLVTALFGDRE